MVLNKIDEDCRVTWNSAFCALPSAFAFEGRWLSPGPLGGDITNPQSLNRYAYALNNPTTLTDPLGLSGVKIYMAPPTDWGDLFDYIFPTSVDDEGDLVTGIDAGAASYFSGGAGGGLPFGGTISVTSTAVAPKPAPNIITWPHLQTLVHENNESNLCDEVVDCIVFNESHVGNTLAQGFNPGAISRYKARGLMQVEKISLKDVLTAGKTYAVPDTTVNKVWGQMFNPALNIEAGSTELQLKLTSAHGNLSQAIKAYGPVSGGPDYANDILNCVQKLQSGNATGAFNAATAHN